MKITVLIENSVNKIFPMGLLGEHGLSLLVEYKKQKILFDTGQTGKVIENAIRLGIELKNISAIVLSHGHYDHTGGLKRILEFVQKPIHIYAHPEILSLHYTLYPVERYIGIPFIKEELESLGANFVWTKNYLEIFPGVLVSGEIPRITSFEKTDRRLVLKTKNKKIPDPVLDDLSLFIKTKKGLVIILGCAPNPSLICANHCTGLSLALKLNYQYAISSTF